MNHHRFSPAVPDSRFDAAPSRSRGSRLMIERRRQPNTPHDNVVLTWVSALAMSRQRNESARDTPRLLVTAGPTQEPIDAVRYIGNRSSGRLGIALAAEAAARRWPTTLLLGPTPLAPESSSHLKVIRFQTTAELQQQLDEQWPSHDVLVMAAAVADFRPIPMHDGAAPDKLRRSGENLTITLEPTPDLLAGLAGQTRSDQTVIGFALEPAERLLRSARDKLIRKRVDAIVANPLETMDAEHIEATILLRVGGELATPNKITKAEFASWLLDHLRAIHQPRVDLP